MSKPAVHASVAAQDDDVTAALAALGLTPVNLRRPLERAIPGASAVTPLDPPNTRGWLRYRFITRFLREELVPLGWEAINVRGYPATVHRERGIAIGIVTGDEATGNPKFTPRNKHPKGFVTKLAVEQNEQLAFPGIEIDTPEIDETLPPDCKTYVLLHHWTTDHIATELSLPVGIVNKYITGYSERIILPPVPRTNVGGLSLPEPPEEVDFDVTRRGE